MLICATWTLRKKVFECVWFAILYIFCKVLLAGPILPVGVVGGKKSREERSQLYHSHIGGFIYTWQIFIFIPYISKIQT